MRTDFKQNVIIKFSKRRINIILIRIVQFLALILIMVSLAGYENTNARIGETNIDFYSNESSDLIRLHVNSAFLDTSLINNYSDIDYKVEKLISDFYKIRNYKTAWTINYKTNSQLDTLINFLDSTEFYGFPKDFFSQKFLTGLINELDSSHDYNVKLNKRIEIDLQATRSVFTLMIYIENGIIKEDTTKAFRDYLSGLPELLNNAFTDNQLKNTINNIHPKLNQYQTLHKALPDLLLIRNVFDSKPDTSIKESQVAKALFYCGILDSTNFDTVNTYSVALEKFQKKYNLEMNGTLNDLTIKKIADQLQKNYYTVCLNLDRLRKIKPYNSDFILVNIPEFLLKVVENNCPVDTYNIVVGKVDTPTPIISSKINRIIANPYWTVPSSIAKNEMLDKIRNDSTYLERNGYYIINKKEEAINSEEILWDDNNPLGGEYWIRQKNSKANALGQVKFLFPNKYSVYIHDTPSKRLFNKNVRAFSHGCIRLQNPLKLAQYLADKYKISRTDSVKIKEIIDTDKREILNFQNNVEIFIQYITCGINNQGLIQFYPDIYSLDTDEFNKTFMIEDNI